MKNKFSFYLGKPRYGWVKIELLNNNKPFITISGSGVYNPFYDLVNFLKKINKNKNGQYIWEIDQEGYNAIIKVTVKRKKILVETETLTNKPTLPKFKITYIKKEFIKEIKSELEKYYSKHKSIIFDDCYDLSFNKYQLAKIKI